MVCLCLILAIVSFPLFVPHEDLCRVRTADHLESKRTPSGIQDALTGS